MPSVYVVGADLGVERMFWTRGWTVLDTIDKADLVQFTGGSDVHPSYYGEAKLPQTSCDLKRDAREMNIFAEHKDKFKAGICRGGQFLNVANGGKMWQHVDNHGLHGTHQAFDTLTGEEVPVTSTHHQMIRPHTGGLVMMVAKESKYKRSYEEEIQSSKGVDVECVYYEATSSLCYQPHPEYCEMNHPCQVWYFDKLKQLFSLGE
jgi:gamma-glutamyl-gamma-aminobutyrate hydrolase PuuD